MRLTRSLISLLPVVCALSSAAASPSPASLEVDDEVVALAAGPSGRPPLAVLGRRSVALFERSGDGWVLAASADLTPWVGDGAGVVRRASGSLEVIEGERGAALTLRIHAAELGLADPIELRQEGARLTRADAPTTSPRADAVPPSHPPERLPRSLDWAPERGEAVSFKIDAESRLVATLATGGTSATEARVGELLLVIPGERGEARVLVSSPSLPGEPDRILEFLWREGRLSPGRQGMAAPGRIAAAVRLDAGRDRLAIATVDRPGHSRVDPVPEEDLWEAP